MLLGCWLAFLAAAVFRPQSALCSYQSPISDSSVSHNDSLSLPISEFTTFVHPLFPGKQLRIKRHKDFCDPTVRSYTGYLDAAYGTQHLFFYFFESRNDPKTDPVVMWINGGPGCSSSTGLFMELGPCRVNLDGNATTFNEYSWNNNANVFFLDQPVGVGYSYADYGIKVETTEDAAPVVQDFVSLFFETFSQFKGRPFHITGESYGGRYIPLFAAEILDHNAKAIAGGLTPINLQSIAIGNGMINAGEMFPTLWDVGCTSVVIEPFMSIADCVEMKRGLPLCLKRTREDCEDNYDAIACRAAFTYCAELVVVPLLMSGKNPYDVSKPCLGDWQTQDCYPIKRAIQAYLNKPDVRKILGVPDSLGEFKGCNHDINREFQRHLDFHRISEHHIAQLLERGVRVLLYDGVLDLVCNRVGYLARAHAIEWTGQAEFANQVLRNWTAGDSGVPAGETKSAKGLLTWATIFGAGHMAPYDKPFESLHLINKWVAGEGL